MKSDSPRAFGKGKTTLKPSNMEKVRHGKGPKPMGGAPAAQRKGRTGTGGSKRGY